MTQKKKSIFTSPRPKVIGFTIVELLIVIVVIAILATISYTSYAGIQYRARATAASANASTVRKVAEAYYSNNNAYPTQVTQFTSSSFVALPSTITLLTSGTLSGTNGENSIMYRYISSGAGACIMYWDFAPASGPAAISTPVYLGSATSSTCNSTTGTLPT